MADNYLKLMVTPQVEKAQQQYFGRARAVTSSEGTDILTQDEIEFIKSRDSFYMATINEKGWPYLQHRGGRPGFLQVISPSCIGFADFKGNRQLLSVGNLLANNKVSLFLMDYPRRARLKILARVEIKDARHNEEWVHRFCEESGIALIERILLMDIVSYDWNCSQYITPRFTMPEIEEAVTPLKRRILELETMLKERNP